jgi:hypothetical protein
MTSIRIAIAAALAAVVVLGGGTGQASHSAPASSHHAFSHTVSLGAAAPSLRGPVLCCG